jgi:hypothetical protein
MCIADISHTPMKENPTCSHLMTASSQVTGMQGFAADSTMMVQVYTTRETSFLNLQIIYTIRSEDN